MSDRAKIKRGIIERLDGLNDKQLRSVYIFALQKSTMEYTEKTAVFEISADTQCSESKNNAIHKLVRLLFQMDERLLHRLYITALNMI